MAEKIPPHDIDAEEAVIGSLLVGGNIATVDLDVVDFWSEAMAMMFKACSDLRERGVSVDEITVADQLHRNDKLTAVGGAATLSRLIASTPTSYDLPFYADIVKRLSTFRKLAAAGERVAAMGYQGSGEVGETLQRADELLLELRRRSGQVTVATPRERADRQLSRYQAFFEQGRQQCISVGLIDVDYQLGGGIFPGDFVVVGARPGMGKTTLLQQVANTVSGSGPVLFASGEMDENGLTDRDVASMLKLPVSAIRRGRYEDEVLEGVYDAVGTLSERQVYLFIGSRHNSFTAVNLYQAASMMQLRYGLKLIVVDYLGLLSDRYGTNQVERLGYISAALKRMAMELGVPVICAHQLNRGVEFREDKRPQLHDLRDSGNIEQDADVVMFLYRDSYYGVDMPDTEIIIAKQRQGPGNNGRIVRVYFDARQQAYRNLAGEGQQGVLA